MDNMIHVMAYGAIGFLLFFGILVIVSNKIQKRYDLAKKMRNL